MIHAKSRTLLLFLVISSIIILEVAAKQKKKSKPAQPDPFKLLLGELREIVKLGLARGSDAEQVCSDACGLLDNDNILRGKRMQDYMPFCEKHCPIALKDAETLGLLNSDEALTSFIMEKYQHDEL